MGMMWIKLYLKTVLIYSKVLNIMTNGPFQKYLLLLAFATVKLDFSGSIQITGSCQEFANIAVRR